MGTSRSSTGSPSGVPMVPPWVPDIEEPAPAEPTSPEQEDKPQKPEVKQPDKLIPIAPAGRFRSTRTSLGKFASSGDSASLRQGVGKYVKTGLGGSSIASKRLAGTARTAGRLYGALGGETTDRAANAIDAALLAGKSAREVINAVIEAACPVDGSQDAEASRVSINDALSDLMHRDAQTDLLKLDEAQRQFVIERFVSMDIYRRFLLDVGGAIQEKAPSATAALARLKEVREYIRETVAASFRKIRDTGHKLAKGKLVSVVQRALRDALDVFSGYAE